MNLINRIKHRRNVKRAIRELSALSNETLRDIGIERGNIAELVEQLMSVDVEYISKVGATQLSSSRQDYHVTGGATA